MIQIAYVTKKTPDVCLVKYFDYLFDNTVNYTLNMFDDAIPYQIEDLLYYIEREPTVYVYSEDCGWFVINEYGDVKVI